jgi:hypothetical protein
VLVLLWERNVYELCHLDGLKSLDAHTKCYDSSDIQVIVKVLSVLLRWLHIADTHSNFCNDWFRHSRAVGEWVYIYIYIYIYTRIIPKVRSPLFKNIK